MRPSISDGLAGAFDNRGVVFIDGDLLRVAKFGRRYIFQLGAEIFGDGLTAGKGCDIFKHGLSAIAEAWGLYRGALQCAAKLIYDKCRQRLALNVFRNDEQGFAGLGGLLQDRKQSPSSS